MATLPVMSLSDLRTAIQQRVDLPVVSTTSFITTAELNSWINGSYFELYDLLVTKFGNDYYVASAFTITTDGTNDHFALPADFYKLLGVDALISGVANSAVSLRQFNFAERNKFAVPNFPVAYGPSTMQYRLAGGQIWLIPSPPASGQTVKLWYIPRLIALALDADTADGVSGWLEYVIVDVCLKALRKQRLEGGDFERDKQALLKRIEDTAENRNAGAPATVADVLGNNPAASSAWGGP